EFSLEHPDDRAVGANGHAFGCRLLRESGHGHDVAGLRDDETGTGRGVHFVNGNAKTMRAAESRGIVGERVLGLRHAHRRVAEPDRLEILDRALCLERVVGPYSAIELLDDGVDLLTDGRRRRIDRRETAVAGFEHGHDLASELDAAVTSLLPYLV